MTSGAIYIDAFASGMDELPKFRQRSTREVLRHLNVAGRFSMFEATDNDVIAATVDRIMRRELVKTSDIGFPWTKVELTSAGKALLL